MSFIQNNTLSSLLLLVLLMFFSVKYYLKWTTGWCKSKAKLNGKTAIITGANTGIGYITALDLAKRGAKVILACRNEEKAEKARKSIIVKSGNDKVIVQLVDFESLDSVRDFAKRIKQTETRLDILVNNAALAGVPNQQTKDGHQIVMQVNHLSPFLLTNLLLGILKKSGKSRIVNVSSMAASVVPSNRFISKDLNEYPGNTLLYCRTKLCTLFFTMELAERLRNTGVTVNSLHPGVIYTDLYREIKGLIKTALNFIMTQFFKTPEAGAQTSIYLAVSEEVEDVSGAHFADCKRINTYRSARDEKMQKELWRISEKLVKLD